MAPKKKSTAERGPTALPKSCGTGFEEFFADPPMTVAEAQEERENIYHPDLSFAERIQSCIQRFRARRRIGNAEATKLFNTYLFLGGVDTSPRAFGAAAEDDMGDMTPEERRAATAVDVVHNTSSGGSSSHGTSRFYSAADEGAAERCWDVDFAGVAAGFLSENLPVMTGWDYPRMGKAVGIVESFLTYVLQHDVCPEHGDNVNEAMAVCERAKVELPLAHQSLIRFPGQFNLALCELFCRDFAFFQDGGDDLGRREEEEEKVGGFRRPADFMPHAVFCLALSAAAHYDGFITMAELSAILDATREKTIEVVDEEDCSMEVVSIQRPNKRSRDMCRQISVNGVKGFAAVGRLVLKPCIVEDGYDRGDIEQQLAQKKEEEQQEKIFYVEDDILLRLQEGFKLQLRVCELNVGGLRFVKQAQRVLVGWHTFLPQNLMRHFKEPVANERPAPSAANPDAEEREDGSGRVDVGGD